ADHFARHILEGTRFFQSPRVVYSPFACRPCSDRFIHDFAQKAGALTMVAKNIRHLGIKELYSLRRDGMLTFLIVYSFTLSIWIIAKSAPEILNKTPIGIVDMDQSRLSQRIVDAFYPPRFALPALVTIDEMDTRLDQGVDTFALNISPHFERDVLAGRDPGLQLNVDATRIGQALIGNGNIQTIVNDEIDTFVQRYRS